MLAGDGRAAFGGEGVNLEQELQTLEQFEQWLESQDARTIIGAARDSCNCPLVRFLSQQEISGWELVAVHYDELAIGDGRLRHSRLSFEFIRQIDDGRKNREPVTVAGAKRALKSARKKIGGEGL